MTNEDLAREFLARGRFACWPGYPTNVTWETTDQENRDHWLAAVNAVDVRSVGAILDDLERAGAERDEARSKRDQWQRELSAERRHAAHAESARRERDAAYALLREVLRESQYAFSNLSLRARIAALLSSN